MILSFQGKPFRASTPIACQIRGDEPRLIAKQAVDCESRFIIQIWNNVKQDDRAHLERKDLGKAQPKAQ